MADLVSKLAGTEATLEARLERGLLNRFDLGCSLPLGVYSEVSSDGYRLKACLGSLATDDSDILTEADCRGQGIDALIDEVYRALCRQDR